MHLATRNTTVVRVCLLISVLLFSIFLAAPAQAQNNTWTNTGSSFWQAATNWSQGAPTSTQSGLFITNANTKTVTIDSTTTNFPGTLTISNLTVTAPVGSVNTLNITNAGFAVPLTILNALTVNSRGVLALGGSRVQVSGSTLIGTAGVGEFSISDGLFNGAAITLGSAAASSGKWTISGGTSQFTSSFDIGGASGSTGLVIVSGGYLVATNTTINVSVQNGLAKLITSNGIIRANGYAVGDTANTVGFLELSGGTNIATSDTLIASRGNSTGRVVMTGGRFESTTSQDIVIGRGGNGEWTLTDGVIFTRNETVGSFRTSDKAGTGKLSISGGTNQLTGTFTVGAIAAAIGTSTGTVLISGGLLDVRLGTALIGSDGVGYFSISNGVFLANNLTAGANPTNLIAQGTVTAAGGQVFVTNATHSSILEIRNGSLLITSNGTVTASRLVLTNSGTGLITFNSGTLNIVRTSLVANTQAFTVGDGIGSATLNLVGGRHQFANGLVISSNSTLKGTGAVVNSMTTISDGGILSPGSSPGTLTLSNLTLNSGSLLDFELGPHNTNGIGYVGLTSNDLVGVTGNLLLDGILNVTALANFNTFGVGPASTNVYRLFNYSGALTNNGLSIGLLPSYAQGFIDLATAGQVNLFVIEAVVPEPTALTLLGLGSIFLLLRSRRCTQ